ncbi:MAG: efflux RND transporter periplasmic adaptor subunit [Rikenellaceae bacterium]
MKKKIIIIAAIIVVAAACYFIFAPKQTTSAPTFTTATVEKQNIVQSITATGTVEPVTVVDVGTQVSGILTTLYVDYNSVVKKGDIIAELDKSTLLLDLNSSKNSLATAKSEYEYQLAIYTRTKALYEKELIADSEYEVALYNYEKTKNSYETAKNNLERSQINMDYATIYSPIDGVVLSRSVEEGQTVASSFSTPTLFSIAADLQDMQVVASVDEADIGNIQEGQGAEFSVDAFPNLIFKGIVTQVRQEAIIESNVVTYEVVISADNPDLKLKPGLTANIEVFTLNQECDKVVPAAALSFTPALPEGGPQAQQGRDGDVVWVKQGDRIEPKQVTVGISNGILTSIESGVEAGAEVVTGMEAGAAMMPGPGGPEGAASSPFVQQRGSGPRR